VRAPVRDAQRSERGVVIIWTAFFLLAMLGFVAIGIDVAKLMATRTQLQNTADAAALAGASAIDFKSGKLVQDAASVRAKTTAAQNKAFVNAPVSVTLLGGDISFPNTNQIKVTVRRSSASDGSMVTHVAQVLGLKTLDVSATAVAQVDTAGEPCEGLVPMAPITPPADWFKPDCATVYQLKADQGSSLSGNYQLLDFPQCSEGPCGEIQGGGAAAIRCETRYGYSCCVKLGDEWVWTQPGNKVGPFRAGIQGRWDADTDRRENICFDEYQGNGNRVVRLPVIETFNVNGKKMVHIIAFSAFFLVKRPSTSDLWGQFVYDIVPGNGGPGKGTLFTIRLVQ